MSRFYYQEHYNGKTLTGAINKVGRFMANARTSDALDDRRSKEAWLFVKKNIAALKSIEQAPRNNRRK